MNNPKIEVDIAEILREIKSELKTTNDRLNSIDTRLVAIETRIDEQKSSIGKIPDLAEKVGKIKLISNLQLILPWQLFRRSLL